MRGLRIVCFAVVFIAAVIVSGCDSTGADAPTAPSKPPADGAAAAPEVPKETIKIMPGQTVKGGPTPNAP